MTDTTTPVDPEMLAARTNCRPECPGPTPAELAGLARPHSCARTLTANPDGQRATAEAFVAEALAGTAALAESRDSARDMAARLEQELADVRAVLGRALDGCPDHETHQVECPVCAIDWWVKFPGDLMGEQEQDVLRIHLAHRADE
jgi:hypothetical protein